MPVIFDETASIASAVHSLLPQTYGSPSTNAHGLPCEHRALRGAMDVHGGAESSLMTALQPRSVERGMRLVALLTGAPRVILQVRATLYIHTYILYTYIYTCTYLYVRSHGKVKPPVYH